MVIFQGDQYTIPIQIWRNNVLQTPTNITKLEVIIVGIRREFYSGQSGDEYHKITFSDGKFYFPLNQDETLNLKPGNYDMFGRAHYTDGTIKGWQGMEAVTVLKIDGAEEI